MLGVPEVKYIGYYQAPHGSNPQPRIIPEGQQDIEIIMAGRGFFEFGDRMIEALPGTVLWHGPGERTIYLNDVENPYECLVISLDSGNKPPIQTVSLWGDPLSLHVFFDQIMNEYHSKDRDMDKLSYHIYGQLYWHGKVKERAPTHTGKRYDEIQRVRQWIDKHFNEEIDLAKLASVADLSIPHLHTVFKNLTHQTPYQYIQSKRILKARKLLATTRLSIKEVCAGSGFRDVGNFCRLFKRTHGLTAQEYRQYYTDKR